MQAIYLVLDLINDIVHEDGPFGQQGFGPEVRRRNVLSNTAQALRRARAANIPIGYVRIGFSPGYGECPPGSQRFQKARENGWFQLGGWGTEVHAAAAPLPGDFDIVKHRVSPFYGTVLEPILSAQRIDTIFVSGVSTNAVVQAAMREGQDRDFRMVLIEDCCSALTPEEHEQALATLRSFGEVTTSTVIDFRS